MLGTFFLDRCPLYAMIKKVQIHFMLFGLITIAAACKSEDYVFRREEDVKSIIKYHHCSAVIV